MESIQRGKADDSGKNTNKKFTNKKAGGINLQQCFEMSTQPETL